MLRWLHDFYERGEEQARQRPLATGFAFMVASVLPAAMKYVLTAVVLLLILVESLFSFLLVGLIGILVVWALGYRAVRETRRVGLPQRWALCYVGVVAGLVWLPQAVGLRVGFWLATEVGVTGVLELAIMLASTVVSQTIGMVIGFGLQRWRPSPFASQWWLIPF